MCRGHTTANEGERKHEEMVEVNTGEKVKTQGAETTEAKPCGTDLSREGQQRQAGRPAEKWPLLRGKAMNGIGLVNLKTWKKLTYL